MQKSCLTIALVALGLCGLASAAYAQDSSWPDGQKPPKTFGQRLGDFGRSIFGGPAEDEVPQPPRSTWNTTAPRAGSVRTAPAQPPVVVQLPDDPNAAVPSPSRTSQTPLYGGPQTSDYNRARTSTGGVGEIASSRRADAEGTVASPSSDATQASIPADSGSTYIPLHERMKGLRQSPFDGGTANKTTTSADSVSDPPTIRQADRSASSGVSIGTPPPGAQVPTLAPRRPDGDATPIRSAMVPAAEPSDTPSDAGGAKVHTDVATRLSTSAKHEGKLDGDGNVLFARKSPNLSVETLGPRRITVGKEAVYEVTIQNAADVAADEVTVFVTLPEWAEVSGADASSGGTRAAPQGSTEAFQWNVGRVEARAREKLSLKIVPRQSRPFELGVRWDYKPSPSQATIEVQEPKLVLQLEGPREVFYGKREVFKLKLANTGTGPAENVAVTLLPVGAGDNQSVSHKLPTLAAGEQRTLEVEVTARQSGTLTIQVEVRGDGGAHAQLAEQIFVRRAGLQVAMDGPAVQYVGTASTYRIHLRNPGNAPAKNVKLSVALPTGVKFVSGSDGAKPSASGNKVQWNVDTLEPGIEREFSLKCNLGLSGACRLEAVSAGDDELAAATEAITRVEAMADLRLEVKDPEGPVPVGQEATYELRIRNRGTKAAQEVEILAYFSNGIEPTAAEGQPHRLGPGQITFSPIPSVPAGADITLKVRARADTPGNHLFRAEVHCKSLGTRLVREETTHFYQDGPVQQASRAPGAMSNAAPVREPVRTAERRPPMPLSPRGGEPPLAPPQPGASAPPLPLR